ncbi:MAG: polysaccharide deacetylase family protein [Gammaproteobacteria bacterium]|nr:polysaccharide deacetylase family protein [Gammaproteobacteria bacterium]
MKNRLAILNYHQVPADADPLHLNTCHRHIFRKQLESLARYFNVISIDEGVRGLFAGKLHRNSVVITFDDGYRNNFEVAFDELQRIGLPATFFIASDYLDGGRMWNDTIIEALRSTRKTALDLEQFELPILPVRTNAQRVAAINAIIPVFKYLQPDEREQAVRRVAKIAEVDLPDDLMMTSAQVKSLHAGGMTIGAHTASHPILRRLPAQDAREDIIAGRDFLEQLVGCKLRYFAYPNGKPGQDYDKTHVQMLSELGFEAAFSTQWGFADRSINRFEIPRVGFGDHVGWRFSLRLLRSYFEAPVQFAA